MNDRGDPIWGSQDTAGISCPHARASLFLVEQEPVYYGKFP